MAFKRNLLFALAAIALLGAAIASYALAQRPTAPDAMFTTLDGRQLRLADLRGKTVAVMFWATSCPICKGEMPDLANTYRKYQPRGFELIAVAMAYDSPEDVKNFAKSRGLPFPVVLDKGGDLARAFSDTKVVPTTFLIDGSGKFVSRTLGAIDFTKLRQYLDASLCA
jgi:peroxiredoxin